MVLILVVALAFSAHFGGHMADWCIGAGGGHSVSCSPAPAAFVRGSDQSRLAPRFGVDFRANAWDQRRVELEQ